MVTGEVGVGETVALHAALGAPERGRIPVLVIDEAHLLNHAQLDALRMMTNHGPTAASRSRCCYSASPPSAG